jgi:hypothetical protein
MPVITTQALSEQSASSLAAKPLSLNAVRKSRKLQIGGAEVKFSQQVKKPDKASVNSRNTPHSSTPQNCYD